MSESGGSTLLRNEPGYVEASTACEDGVDAFMNPDAKSVTPGTAVKLRRMSPANEREIRIDAAPKHISSGHMEVTDASCAESRVVGLAYAADTNDNSKRMAVAVMKSEDQDRHLLLRVNPDTGETSVVSKIDSNADRSTLLRIQDNTLYVLAVTRDSDSVLRALSLIEGRVMGEREFEALDRRVKGRLASFPNRQVVRDFVVLEPVAKW